MVSLQLEKFQQLLNANVTDHLKGIQGDEVNPDPRVVSADQTPLCFDAIVQPCQWLDRVRVSSLDFNGYSADQGQAKQTQNSISYSKLIIRLSEPAVISLFIKLIGDARMNRSVLIYISLPPPRRGGRGYQPWAFRPPFRANWPRWEGTPRESQLQCWPWCWRLLEANVYAVLLLCVQKQTS